MANIEADIIAHYEDGALLERINQALAANGIDPERLSPGDLAPIEEFHIGGRKATEHAVQALGLSPEQHVLDIGCGIGGAARYIASTVGSEVTGIDLTPDFIHAAKALTRSLGLDTRVHFEIANALSMPFEAAAFDAAITFHVAMNIADRAGLYAEMARVLKPGAKLCVYDVMKTDQSELVFPLPWAETAQTSFLISPDTTAQFLRDAGFEVTEVENRRDFALDFFRQGMAAQNRDPGALGLHMLMGDAGKAKMGNASASIEAGHIAPVQMIARRV